MAPRQAWLIAIGTFVALFSAIHPVLDPDMWWHLVVGEEILNRRSVHFIDPFSFTHPTHWVNTQWLAEVFFAAFQEALGLLALEAFALALKVGAFLFVFATTTAPFLTRLWVVVLCALCAAPVMGGVRPQLFSYLSLSALSWWLHRYRKGQGNPFWLPVLFALWANIHSFYPIAFGLFSLALIADFWDERMGWGPTMTRRKRWHLFVALLLSAFSLGLTPFGWEGIRQVIANIVKSSQLPIVEWQPLLKTRHPVVYLWSFLLLLWVIGIGWSPKRMDTLEFFWGSVLTLSVLSGVRMVALWCLLMAPFLADHIGAWTERKARSVRPWSPRFATFLSLSVGGIVFIWSFSPPRLQRREGEEYPRAAISWMEGQKVLGRCFVRYGWAGYVLWRLKGRCQVFVDGRADFYPLSVMRDYLAAYQGRKNWREILKRYGVNLVLIPPDTPLASLLRLCPDEWRKAYEDERAILFIRKISREKAPDNAFAPKKPKT